MSGQDRGEIVSLFASASLFGALPDESGAVAALLRDLGRTFTTEP